MWIDKVGNGHRLNPLVKVQVDPEGKGPSLPRLGWILSDHPPRMSHHLFPSFTFPLLLPRQKFN